MYLIPINILLRWQNTTIMLYIDMQFMLHEELPDTVADMVIAKCVRNR